MLTSDQLINRIASVLLVMQLAMLSAVVTWMLSRWTVSPEDVLTEMVQMEERINEKINQKTEDRIRKSQVDSMMRENHLKVPADYEPKP